MKLELDWVAIAGSSRFKRLQRRKLAFLSRLFLFGVFYYFLLPVGAAWYSDIFRIKVWGPVNFGLLFAFSQFLVAWGIAFWYARKSR